MHFILKYAFDHFFVCSSLEWGRGWWGGWCPGGVCREKGARDRWADWWGERSERHSSGAGRSRIRKRPGQRGKYRLFPGSPAERLKFSSDTCTVFIYLFTNFRNTGAGMLTPVRLRGMTPHWWPGWAHRGRDRNRHRSVVLCCWNQKARMCKLSCSWIFNLNNDYTLRQKYNSL